MTRLVKMTMNCIIRPLELEDEPFLWEMLYQAIYVPEGQTPLPREIIQIPEVGGVRATVVFDETQLK